MGFISIHATSHTHAHTTFVEADKKNYNFGKTFEVATKIFSFLCANWIICKTKRFIAVIIGHILGSSINIGRNELAVLLFHTSGRHRVWKYASVR